MQDKIKILRDHFIGPSGKTKAYYTQDSELAKRPDIVEIIESLLPRTDMSIQVKIRLLCHNNGDRCNECHTAILPKIGSSARPYTCRECVVKLSNEERQSTMIDRYGAAHALQVKEHKEKVKATNREKFGTDYAAQADHIKQKMKDTTRERYGVDHAMHCEEIKERVRSTQEENGGVGWARKETLDKAKVTMVELYGVDHPQRSDVIKEQTRLTNMQRYGATNPMQNKEIANKSRENCSKNWAKMVPYITENIDLFYDEYVNSEKTLSEFSNELGVSSITLSAYFRKCGYTILNRPGKYGQAQQKLADSIQSVTGLQPEMNNRSVLGGKEIDIWFPDQKIGVEYHGVYWHQEQFAGKNSHQEKAILARDNGIRLYQFFSSEVENKNDIIISMITNALGKASTSVAARKCKVIEINNQMYREFCEQNHLQGYASAKHRYGLIHEGELLSVMSFGASRFDKVHEYEMIRFCTKLNIRVIGGASKLWKHFIKTMKPSSVVTYADARFSIGNLYDRLGFTHLHMSHPNYFYTKPDTNVLESRIKYQKHKLKDMWGYFDDLTEQEIMELNGYARIYDAGTLVYSWCQ